MWILGIETSIHDATIALLDGDRLFEERTLPRTGRRHAQTLVQEIGALLSAAGLKPADLAAIAVSIGPGSFTGLRVGVVCAKTLSFATGRPLLAVETLLAAAEQAPADVREVHVIADAQRREVYAARYVRTEEGVFEPAGDVQVTPLVSWLEERQPEDVVTGPGVRVCAERLEGMCRVLPEALREPRAETVARIGRRLLERGQFADAAALEPFYIRPSAAEEKRLKAN